MPLEKCAAHRAWTIRWPLLFWSLGMPLWWLGAGCRPAAAPAPVVTDYFAVARQAPLPEFVLPRGVPSGSGHARMLRELYDISCDETQDLTRVAARESLAVSQRLVQEDLPIALRLDMMRHLGMTELARGDTELAINILSTALERAQQHPLEITHDFRQRVLYELSIAYLRLGESDNCCAQHTAESCILPIRNRAIHNRPRGSTEAIRCLTQLLRGEPQMTARRMSALWLMNVAGQTLGKNSTVPPEFQVPDAVFQGTPTAGTPSFPHFRNVAIPLGLDCFDLAGGAVVEDFDNDGKLDIITSTMNTSGPMHFYRSQRDGTFAERAEAAQLTGLYGGLNMVSADYDNDGDIDLLVLRGGWLATAGRHPNSLLRNEGDGTFTDVTFEAGLGEVHYPTQNACWADYDRDGDLDLFIGNEHGTNGPPERHVDAPCQLFRNNGDGRFVDVAEAAGVTNRRYAKGSSWGDFDGDGRLDLYVSNLAGANRLYRQGEDGTFEDVAEKLGVAAPHNSFPCWFWDYNNDGALDISVWTYGAQLADAAASYLGYRTTADTPKLYQGNGRGAFEEVAAARQLTRPDLVMGSNFADLDGDGWLDAYLGTGTPAFESLTPNVMYRNEGGERFADVSAAGGFAHLQKGHGVAFADFDEDGDLDVFEQMGGALPADGFADVLFENPGPRKFSDNPSGPDRDWVAIETYGVRSDRRGVAAHWELTCGPPEARRTLHRWGGTGGSFGCNPFRQTIGLGSHAGQVDLRITWPTTGEVQVFTSLPLGCLVRIVEGASHLEAAPLQPTPWRLADER